MTSTDTTPRPGGRTSVRHVRIPDDVWRTAAARAEREGHGVAELVRALVTAYAAGQLDAPRPAAHPDAWACLACRSEEVAQGKAWLEAPCPAHRPTTTTPAEVRP